MTVFGVDYSQGYNIHDLVAAGAKFACRYIGFASYTLPQDKMITYSEAYDLSKNGIAIVSNFEWTGDRASIHNGFYNGNATLAFQGGVEDARLADVLHKSIGGPSDRPIYFSVDYNTDGTDTDDYFKGLRSVLGSRVGGYGPYAAIKHLSDSGLINWRWQTYAWSGGNWLPNNHIQQYNNGVQMGSMVVDYDKGMVGDFGQWMLPANAPKPVWYQYPICVPFGNANFDSGLGGSHDLDVAAPANTEVTSLVSGTISDLSAPDWGKQVGIKLDNPINGISYLHHLHLSALNPSLSVGSRVKPGDLLGWVGGGNTQAQYNGTSNPTGQNFTNSPNSSSRIQTGLALMDGPSYGSAGWVNFPPIDMQLDPTPTLQAARNAFTFSGGGEMLPAGWTDDGKALHNPVNSFVIVNGFRLHVLADPSWEAGDVPLENEYGVDSIEDSNPTLGPGTRQLTVKRQMYWRKADGSINESWLGKELYAVRKDRDAKDAALAEAEKTIADLTAQLAAAQSGGITPELQAAINQAVAAQPSVDAVLQSLKPFVK